MKDAVARMNEKLEPIGFAAELKDEGMVSITSTRFCHMYVAELAHKTEEEIDRLVLEPALDALTCYARSSLRYAEKSRQGKTALTFDEYSDITWDLAKYPDKGDNITYPILGICGESGEIADKFKKILRDKDSHMSEEDRIEILKEIGDVLWYLSALSIELKTDLGAVAKMNITKLRDRNERGVLGGSGDNR